MEYGKLEIPHKPVIRFCTSVFNDQGVKKGILVINYNVEDAFSQFNILQRTGNLKQFYLLDYQGYYLRSPTATEEWGNILETNISFAKNQPALWNTIQTKKNDSIVNSKEVLQFYSFSVFDSKFFNLSNVDYSWVAVIIYDNSYISFVRNETYNSLISILAPYYLIFLTIGFFISYNLTTDKIRENEVKITEKKHNEKILITNTFLNKQKSELSEFAHTMSHDIKNYTGIIKQFLDLINPEKNDPNLSVIRLNVEKIDSLLSHSLNLAESGLVIDKKEEINMNKLLHDLALNYREVTFIVKSDFPIIYGDQEKILQILTNIIKNNISHGEASEITFDYYISDNEKNLYFTIQNNGKEIEEKYVNQIFKRGFTTSSKGNGLGLHIAQKIVLSHGWKINLSDPEKVTFSILIPLSDVKFE